jgi:hypothetical protein
MASFGRPTYFGYVNSDSIIEAAPLALGRALNSISGRDSLFRFFIGLIKIIVSARLASGCLMELDHTETGVAPMKSEYPFNPTPGKSEEEMKAPPSRFIDEKISDETGTETNADSAMAPAGLSNPFWN